MTTSPGSAGSLLVLAAMPEESAPLTARLEGAEVLDVPLSGVSATRGVLAGTETVVVTTGIGVAAATAAATWAMLGHRPAVTVAAGSCGGLAADVEVGTLIVGDSFAWSLADATAFGYAPGQVPGGPEQHVIEPAWGDLAERCALAADARGEQQGTGHGVRRGLMISGDAFVTASIAEPMRDRFPGALSADMETTASARTAEALGVPFLALRAVSDLCGPAAGQQFHLEIDLVSEISARAVEVLARQLAD